MKNNNNEAYQEQLVMLVEAEKIADRTVNRIDMILNDNRFCKSLNEEIDDLQHDLYSIKVLLNQNTGYVNEKNNNCKKKICDLVIRTERLINKCADGEKDTKYNGLFNAKKNLEQIQETINWLVIELNLEPVNFKKNKDENSNKSKEKIKMIEDSSENENKTINKKRKFLNELKRFLTIGVGMIIFSTFTTDAKNNTNENNSETRQIIGAFYYLDEGFIQKTDENGNFYGYNPATGETETPRVFYVYDDDYTDNLTNAVGDSTLKLTK